MAIEVRTFVSVRPKKDEPFAVLVREGIAWDVGQVEEVDTLIAALQEARQAIIRFRAQQRFPEQTT